MVWAVLIEQLVCQIFPFYFREEQETLPTFGNLTGKNIWNASYSNIWKKKEGKYGSTKNVRKKIWKFEI